MKVTVKRVFFDNNGLHKVGEITEVEQFDEDLMEPVIDKKPEKKSKETK